jgi:ligand-binding sensor domain-containing protein
MKNSYSTTTLHEKKLPILKPQIKHIILLFTLLLFSASISAQNISYRNLTTKDGLPSNTIYQIKQDKKGFIWIATANGLVRYDGKRKTINLLG